MKIPKELEQAAELAVAAGWRIVQPGGGHIKWFHPDGVTIIVTSATPSDIRSSKNAISKLRGAGLVIPRRQSKKRRRSA